MQQPENNKSELSTLRAAASAPKAELTDERAAFETSVRSMPGHPFAGKFLNLMWAAWQARAVLAQAAPVADVTSLTELRDVLGDAFAAGKSVTLSHAAATALYYAMTHGTPQGVAQAAPVAAVPEGWKAAANWLRNHYQDHANIAALCDAMLAAAPATPVAAAVPAGWVKNTGVQPVADDVLIEVKFRHGGNTCTDCAGAWQWDVEHNDESDIMEWRLAAPAPDEASK
jgi:hypothetical protein